MSKTQKNKKDLLQQKYDLDEEYYSLIYRLVAIQCCVPDRLQVFFDDFVDIEVDLIQNGVPISKDHIQRMKALIKEIADQVTKMEVRHGKRV